MEREQQSKQHANEQSEDDDVSMHEDDDEKHEQMLQASAGSEDTLQQVRDAAAAAAYDCDDRPEAAAKVEEELEEEEEDAQDEVAMNDSEQEAEAKSPFVRRQSSRTSTAHKRLPVAAELRTDSDPADGRGEKNDLMSDEVSSGRSERFAVFITFAACRLRAGGNSIEGPVFVGRGI